MSNAAQVIDYINTHTLTGLKAGHARTSFLNIWMVVVEDKIYARSWGLAEKSWYHTFLSDPAGQVKCGDLIFPIIAQPVLHDEALTAKINQAYLDKYNHGDNAYYAQGIIQPKHAEKTMEFIVVENNEEPVAGNLKYTQAGDL